MRPKPKWHAEARAMHADGASYREIAERFGVGNSAIYRMLNPERAKLYSERDNARPERKAAKKAATARRTKERQARYNDRDPEIPGLLPLWNAHNHIVDFARVDLADWEWLRSYRFSVTGPGYVQTRAEGRTVYLHHLLVGHIQRGSGRQSDHINRDKLDNRRENLRVVTPKENQHNRGGMHERCWWRQLQAA